MIHAALSRCASFDTIQNRRIDRSDRICTLGMPHYRIEPVYREPNHLRHMPKPVSIAVRIETAPLPLTRSLKEQAAQGTRNVVTLQFLYLTPRPRFYRHCRTFQHVAARCARQPTCTEFLVRQVAVQGGCPIGD